MEPIQPPGPPPLHASEPIEEPPRLFTSGTRNPLRRSSTGDSTLNPYSHSEPDLRSTNVTTDALTEIFTDLSFEDLEKKISGAQDHLDLIRFQLAECDDPQESKRLTEVLDSVVAEQLTLTDRYVARLEQDAARAKAAALPIPLPKVNITGDWNPLPNSTSIGNHTRVDITWGTSSYYGTVEKLHRNCPSTMRYVKIYPPYTPSPAMDVDGLFIHVVDKIKDYAAAVSFYNIRNAEVVFFKFALGVSIPQLPKPYLINIAKEFEKNSVVAPAYRIMQLYDKARWGEDVGPVLATIEISTVLLVKAGGIGSFSIAREVVGA